MRDHSESQILVVDDMPRYFFHISRGKHTFTDSAGVELVGIAAARTHATTKIRDMRATLPSGHLQNWSGWTMSELRFCLAGSQGNREYSRQFGSHLENPSSVSYTHLRAHETR